MNNSTIQDILIETLKSGDQSKPYLTIGNKSYNRAQLIEHIQQQDDIGMKIISNVLSLSMDLLSRGKRKIE